jgi:hypothetical protein
MENRRILQKHWRQENLSSTEDGAHLSRESAGCEEPGEKFLKENTKKPLTLAGEISILEKT